MQEPLRISITHDSTAVKFLKVKTVRLDIGGGEPQCLGGEIEIAPGDTIRVPLHCGATLIITDPS